MKSTRIVKINQFKSGYGYICMMDVPNIHLRPKG
jgi:hypothetical protein